MTHVLVTLVVAYVQFFYRMAVFAGLESAIAAGAPPAGASWQQWSYFSMVTLITLVKLTIVACVAVGAPVWAAQLLWFLSRRAWTHARTVLLCAGILAMAVPAHAQLVVIDPINIAKAVIIVEHTFAQYETLIEQYNRLLEMSARLPGMDAYKLHPIAIGRHDVGRYPDGRPVLVGLNVGDPRGDLYSQVISAIPVIAGAAAALPPAARRVIENQVAAVEIADSVLQRGIHQVGALRSFSGALDEAIWSLEDSVTNPRTAYHYFTAVADKISAAELIGRQQDEAANQLASHALEQQILKAKRDRDTAAEVLNMHLNGILYGREAQEALTGTIDSDMASWRQP